MINLKIKAEGLTERENKILKKTIMRFNQKRKRDNMPRLLYKIRLG